VMRRITVKDIAKEVNLSAQAVSLALRGAKEIPAKTRDRVREIANNLGYIKNHSASILKSGKTKIIAVIYDNLMNPYFSIMTHYLQSAFDKFEYNIMVYNSKSQTFDQNVFKNCVYMNVDGIITFLQPTKDIIELSEKFKKPVLLLGGITDIVGVDYISTDEFRGGQIVAERLLKSGIKKFLFVATSLQNNCAKERLKGFESKLKEFDAKECTVIETIDKSTTECLKEFAQTNNLQEFGIFCFNDNIALEAMSFFESINVKPKLVGYDNVQSSIKMPCRLTTVGSDHKQMAQVAAEVVVFKVNNPLKYDKQFLKYHDVYLVEGVTA